MNNKEIRIDYLIRVRNAIKVLYFPGVQGDFHPIHEDNKRASMKFHIFFSFFSGETTLYHKAYTGTG